MLSPFALASPRTNVPLRTELHHYNITHTRFLAAGGKPKCKGQKGKGGELRCLRRPKEP